MSMNLKAYNLIGQAERFLNTGAYQKALSHYEICLEHEPDNAEILNNTGYCWARLNKNLKALPYFESAVRGAPHNSGYLTNLACCLSHLGRHEDALPYFEQALRDEAQNPLFLANLGGCQAALGKKVAAKNLRAAFILAQAQGLDEASRAMMAVRAIAQNYGITIQGLDR